MTVEVRRAADRFLTIEEGLESRHSFSFGKRYDPANVGFGMLVAHNEDVVARGRGYAAHPHRDLEIVTWVLSGALRHTDSGGTTGLVYPGLAQRLSAGAGVLHSELADGDEPAHFVQMWVRPEELGVTPGYAQHDVGAALATGDLVAVAAGRGDEAAMSINQPAATFYIARLQPQAEVSVPAAVSAHLFVARGRVDLEGAGELRTGDTARMRSPDGRAVTADGEGAEVLVWTFSG